MTLTSVSSRDDPLQNLVFERSQYGLYDHVVVGSGGESDQGGGCGRARQADLQNETIRREMRSGVHRHVDVS